MRLAHGVQWQRTVFRKGIHFHTGREFIMGWTRWGEVIIRIMPQPRQGRLLHGAILSQRLRRIFNGEGDILMAGANI